MQQTIFQHIPNIYRSTNHTFHNLQQIHHKLNFFPNASSICNKFTTSYWINPNTKFPSTTYFINEIDGLYNGGDERRGTTKVDSGNSRSEWLKVLVWALERGKSSSHKFKGFKGWLTHRSTMVEPKTSGAI